MTVLELQELLASLLLNGQVLPHSEVTLAVNEDFSDLDFVDPDGPDYRSDNPHGRLWLCGTSDEDQWTSWELTGDARESAEEEW